MSSTLTKRRPGGQEQRRSTHNIQCRLYRAEIRELDQMAASQVVPVTRARLFSHILREWMKREREKQR